MWYDADIDAVMSRTANRPIPAGRIRARSADASAWCCSGFSVMMLGSLATNWLAAGCSPSPSSFMPSIYTMWLKRSTPQNIVIGGAAGAFPPMIGWAAVTGHRSASESSSCCSSSSSCGPRRISGRWRYG
jgi:protoheme IX farnesyltransferase